MSKIDFDYIIIGAGAAGLMLANAMGADPHFREKSILVLDKDQKKSNDRTWCFWESGKSAFDSLLHRSWPDISFKASTFSKKMSIAPYTYRMVKGLDFYEAYKTNLAGYGNIKLIHEEVRNIREEDSKVVVETSAKTYAARQVFSSIFNYDTVIRQKKYPVLQQHFVGWFVRAQNEVFEPKVATFMDFSVAQNGNTRFMYVLPFSKTEALVEYTLFSEKPLEQKDYELAIKEYLKKDLKVQHFELLEVEKGNIPMTCYDFSRHNTSRVLHIGIAGGWAKASTGYTFMNTDKKVALLIKHLKKPKPLTSFEKRNKYWYYDLLLLDILKRDNSKGGLIFSALFKKRSPQLILRFLGEESSFWDDLKIISACPKRPFIGALLRRLF